MEQVFSELVSQQQRLIESAIHCSVCSRGGFACYGLILRFARPYGSVIYIGYMLEGKDGYEFERVEAVACRRCSDRLGTGSASCRASGLWVNMSRQSEGARADGRI